jgi:DNA-directed RNA polymerase I, II, and III subunit RPABC2
MTSTVVNKISPFDDASKVLANLDKPKISKMIMTKYEFDQVIGLRTMQLAHGAPAFVNTENLVIQSNMELRQVALQELKEGKLPFIIKRPLPNNKFEQIRVKDLDLIAVKYMIL